MCLPLDFLALFEHTYIIYTHQNKNSLHSHWSEVYGTAVQREQQAVSRWLCRYHAGHAEPGGSQHGHTNPTVLCLWLGTMWFTRLIF